MQYNTGTKFVTRSIMSIVSESGAQRCDDAEKSSVVAAGTVLSRVITHQCADARY